jgi:hypothetical protein
MHAFCICTITLYIDFVYNRNDQSKKQQMLVLMTTGFIWPLTYDTIQLFKDPCDYFTSIWNWFDLTFIYCGAAMIVTQFIYDPFSKVNESMLFIVIITGMLKTFFFLRVFDSMSNTIAILGSVIG